MASGGASPAERCSRPPKLHGRAFYESLGSPKYILAPMVAQSEYAWRRLTRSFLTSKSDEGLISYSPMLHARMFADNPKYRDQHFQALKIQESTASDGPTSTPFLDGHPKTDRPLFVQFCANEPDALLEAAKYVQDHCDAVDLNLGCPQGIARRGHYGAFLQEDQPLIYRLVNRLHNELDIPVTAKMRILDTREKTLAYAKLLLDAGASIITVHGRQRDQKGHKTGLADWKVLRYLRESLPPDTVMFANGNILQHGDLTACLEVTGADGVMSAEGNLYDPSIFALAPPEGQDGREYFRTAGGRGGYRMDAVLRRYLHIIYTEVLEQPSPERRPLFLPGDAMPRDPEPLDRDLVDTRKSDDGPPPTKKQKRASATKSQTTKTERVTSPNLTGMQAHLFNLLRPLVAKHHHIRDGLAKVRAGDMPAFERVLAQVELVTAEALVAYSEAPEPVETEMRGEDEGEVDADETRSSLRARNRCRRPWWVCQPYIRPLPEEALAKGAIRPSKKDQKATGEQVVKAKEADRQSDDLAVNTVIKAELEERDLGSARVEERGDDKVEKSNEGLVCG